MSDEKPKMSDEELEYATRMTNLMFQNADHGLNSFGKKDRSFDCRMCGSHYIPEEKQWIFHDLCDPCYAQFDAQKMEGRYYTWMGGAERGDPKPAIYFESAEEWMAWKKSQQTTTPSNQ